jgi:cohesin domain-containing protein/PEP-CTERM motif-containing protein
MKFGAYKTFFAAAALLLFSASAFADGATLSVQPASSTISPGGTVTLDVDIAGVTDLYAYQFDLLFGSSTVSATTETEGDFLGGGGTTFFIPGTVDNVGGSITATANTLIGAIGGVSGDGTLVVLTFTGLAGGTTSIDFANVMFYDSNFNSIDVTTEAGSVTVQGGGGGVPAPEPSSFLLLGFALVGLATLAAKKAVS